MAKLIFSPEWLDELKSRLNIVDVISRYVPLKRVSRDYVGVCPFHNEKTPSFMINEAGQYYHCFGCKASGDMIKFVEKYENIGFYEAVQILADMANMPLPSIDNNVAEEIQQKKKERQQILAVLKATAQYYYKNLYSAHPNAEQARKYLDKRQISKESIVRFGIGCSLDFESLISYLRSLGFSTSLMVKAGVVSNADGRYYDSYGKRLMFPLIDTNGDVIGFSGRLLEDKDLAKYKNTTQTPVFNKSEVVFAINLLKKQRDKERQAQHSWNGFDNIIIVEGQIDVISMHQHGFNNTVACLGTAITPQHVRKLKQFSDNIILMLDGDFAGQKAALRSIDTLRAGGVNIKVVTIPDGHDPDEFLKLYGTEKMKELLATGEEGMDYKFRVLATRYNLNSNYERTKFIHEALLVLKALTNESEQDVYLKVIQKYTGVAIEVLRADLQNLSLNTQKPFYERDDEEEKEQRPPKPTDAYTLADEYLLASIIFQKPYINTKDYLTLHFEQPLQPVYDYVLNTIKSNKEVTLSGLYSRVDVDNSNDEIRATANFAFTPDDVPELTYQSCLLKNQEKFVKSEKSKCENALDNTTDVELQKSLMRKIMEYTKQIVEINKQMQNLSQEYVRLTDDKTKNKNDTHEEE